ncbi:MAG: AmmeMemoRadiSam system protein B [Desulfobacteraceae bacterium]|nr:AmmeMemoRadiSam system protein B [Desulfobacteraceae bacterium]MBC2757908.1 AmmeMemoRadiSam system protein B [Desulfobacteraceae bacterium]
MTPLICKLIKLFIFLVGILFLCTHPVLAQQVRKPVYDGSFYPKNRDDLIALINYYTKLAENTPVSLPVGVALKALILPHAGYIYSGFTASHSSKVFTGKKFNKIIIMGPDHHVGFTNCAISNASAFKTPLGKVNIHPDSLYLCQKYKELFRPIKTSDSKEHSIEVQIPFLQHYLQGFQIVPIVMGPGDIQKYADAIDTVINSETLIVVSSDLSHYLPYAQAVKTDHETIRHILELNTQKLSDKNHRACGIIPIQVLTQLAVRHHWQPLLLHYSNSGDTAGTREKVVGYAAIAFYETSAINHRKGLSQMDKEKGDILLRLARNTIADSLNIEIAESDELSRALADDIFNSHRGTFVTLKINNQLRGCIGNLSADKSILESVKDNAINAAFHDPRFPSLSKKELDNVDIEISLLTDPQPLEYKDGNDLLDKLRPNVDGVIIRKGVYSATFLPQVWEQLPDKKSFLEHLCQKAGLSSDEWRQPGLEVMVYQVQYFEEDH